MFGNHATKAIVGAALCGLSVPAFAQQTPDNNLKAEIASLKAEMAQLRQAQGENWLNERRAEEVKNLVREVLSDADTRASLLEDGVYAGHDGHFFLQSADGAFRLNVSGQMQFRYIVNHDDGRDDEDVSGFQFRRIKLTFDGHVGDPRIGYKIVLGTDRDTGDVGIDDAIISYQITDQLEVLGGHFKLPFLRQELTSSKRQLAVDRGLSTEFFSLDRAEQVQLRYTTDMFRLTGAFSDGANSGFSDYNAPDAEYALTGRVDVKVAGNDWSAIDDTTSWNSEELAAFVGAAVHYERQESIAADSRLDWTLDGSIETGPLGVMAAVMGSHSENVNGSGVDLDQYGFLAEAGYRVNEQLEPFVRWEWIDTDSDTSDEVQAVTAGVNYYLRKHAAKFTADAVWIYDGGYGGNDGLGLASTSGDEDQIALRAQFQLLF